MYFPDLTPYEYFKGRPSALNIGWLDAEHPFVSGDVPQGFVERLRVLVSKPCERTRGFHICQFCDFDPHLVIYDQDAVRRLRETGALSSAEIRVVGHDGTVYASPTLICHYVAAHRYQPPQEFIQAVMEAKI
jgi:hypothetical protein